MKETDSRIFLDSSIWMAYFFGIDRRIKKLIESGEHFLLTSIISLFEVKKRLIIENLSESKVEEAMNSIKRNSLIINLNEKICDRALVFALKNRLYTVGSLIYVSAIESRSILITLDSHFRGLGNIELINL